MTLRFKPTFGRVGGSAGFTLLETLVVLVITSLVSVVLVQGMGLVLSARTSVENKLVDADQFILQRNILLDPLRGVVPDYPNRPNIFNGQPRQVHGFTVRPLEERLGSPVGFTMVMDYDSGADETFVTYQEEGAEKLVVARWPGNIGNFYYRDRAGEWAQSWPPAGLAADEVSQTPFLIRVEMGTGVPSSLIASVDGAHRRPVRLIDTPFFTLPN
ncbi:MAG: PulJ/GspJ family protein [Rhodospirillaceae bacterium]